MAPKQNANGSIPLVRWPSLVCYDSPVRRAFLGTSGLSIFLILLCGLLTTGCTPRVIVRAHPTSSDRGIRYYRPKPYLKVEPAEVAIEKNQTTIVPGLVRISLAYLPDFSEEYAIDVRSGLGIANVGIKLEDGWNLTEISQELDSQSDENLKSVASLLSAVGDVVPTASGPTKTAEASFTVPARNVPIGFYESIIARDSRGCKRLYGFRYVGFVPFANCPLDMGGQQAACCNDPQAGLYGLSFVNGQMVFLPLNDMANSPAVDARAAPIEKAETSKAGRTSAVGSPAEPISLPVPDVQLRALEVQLHAHLNEAFDDIGEVRAATNGERTAISIRSPRGVPSLPIRHTVELWLQSIYGDVSRFDIELLPE